MIKNIKAITLSSYLAMFFLGVAASLIGAAARNIGLSPAQIGFLGAVQNIGLPVGGILLPFFISLITGYASFQISLLLFPLACLVAFSLLLIETQPDHMAKGAASWSVD